MGDEVALPANDTNLETPYSAQNYTDVASNNEVRVGQTATDQYTIHQFKDYIGSAPTVNLEWEGQTNMSPTLSPVYLQIYNRAGVNTYYFNDSTPIDNNNVWTDDASAFDGSTDTFAYITSNSTDNYLLGEGTNSSGGSGTNQTVRARGYGNVNDIATLTCAIYNDG
jgi:hypothetical protein